MSQSTQTMLQTQIGLSNWNLVYAFKVARCCSNISFLRWCRSNKMVPAGLMAQNRLANTYPSYSNATFNLVKKQSRQWLQLAIDLAYSCLDSLKQRCCFPLCREDSIIYDQYIRKLEATKSNKKRKLSAKYEQQEDSNETQEPLVGFVNLSDNTFTTKEIAVLNKGPSFVPPPATANSSTAKIILKGEIQTCYDRMQSKDAILANSANVTEFLSGCLRLNQAFESSMLSKKQKETAAIVSKLKKISRHTPIMPSDKTKRLIALNEDQYSSMLKNALNSTDPVVRSIHPKSVQSKFNSLISSIAKHYAPESEIHNHIMKCKVSEPLPSHAYTLPKDHKQGPLKGRPIISTTNSAIKGVAKLINTILTPLLKPHVPAHLESTQDFKETIDNTTINNNQYFYSLDVTNLYGSIPINDEENTTGLITVVTKFFEQHQSASTMPGLSSSDFQCLLKICLTEDRYLLDGDCRKQTKGISMGNPAAPPLAIIFMDSVEKELLNRAGNAITIWKRYIDDCFVISNRPPDSIIQMANSINKCIQFTVETPSNNSLAFLDTEIIKEENKFQTKLFFKDLHSGTCLPFDSFCPISRKRNLVQSEILRSNRNSSAKYKTYSKNLITKRLQNNGFTKKFISQYENSTNSLQTDQNFTTFLRLPFQGPAHQRAVRRLLHQTGLEEKLRVIFQTEKPLSHQFRVKRSIQSCSSNCLTCQCAITPDKCLKKFAVYRIECLKCTEVYIGETYRTSNSRIKEHLTSDSSKVHQHLQKCCSVSHKNIKWKPLTHIQNKGKRLTAEALFQRQEENKLMDGCESKVLLPYLP